MLKIRALVLMGISILLVSACAYRTVSLDRFNGRTPVNSPVEESISGKHFGGEESQGEPMRVFECENPFEGENPGFNTGYWEKTNFCKHSVDYSEIISGGPPPDGIPPIDDPRFVPPDRADEWLEDNEPVIFLAIEEDVRAYPLQIMTWHEIVNDTVGGVPTAVTFCPLCNTALVFIRPVVNGEILTFGTSGNLRNSDLVMYDRQTESWWQQFDGKAIVGDLTGTKLDFIPAMIISWKDFKSNYPTGKVLSRETGYDRSYGRNPYVGYDDVNSSPFLFSGEVDDRLRPMDRVVGVLYDEGMGKAYPYSTLQEEKVINDAVGEQSLVIFWKGGTVSALDTENIPDGADVGSTGVFSAFLDGQHLTFRSSGEGQFQDQQTGTTWDFLGKALKGPLRGSSLTPIPHHDTFWFAWGAFLPSGPLLEE